MNRNAHNTLRPFLLGTISVWVFSERFGSHTLYLIKYVKEPKILILSIFTTCIIIILPINALGSYNYVTLFILNIYVHFQPNLWVEIDWISRRSLALYWKPLYFKFWKGVKICNILIYVYGSISMVLYIYNLYIYDLPTLVYKILPILVKLYDSMVLGFVSPHLPLSSQWKVKDFTIAETPQ